MRRRSLRIIAKVTIWTLMAVTLYVAGMVLCIVRVLDPQVLTPLLTRYANHELDGDVYIGNVDLGFRRSYPFISIDIDTIVITSRQMKALPAQRRAQMPEWADTLLSIDRLKGGISIPEALAGRLDISDVEIYRPQLNIFTAEDVDNYSVFRRHDSDDDDDDGDDEGIDLPPIRLRHFRFVEPKPVRYADIVNDVNVTANLSAFDISDIGEALDGTPRYTVRFDSKVSYPVLQSLGLGSELPVRLDGTLQWSSRSRKLLVVSGFKYTVGNLSGVIDSEIDFSDAFTLNSLDFTLNPVSVTWLLGIVPDSTAVRLSIPKDIDTDAGIAMRLTIQRPYRVGEDVVPHATLRLSLPDCHVRWHGLDVDRLALDTEVQVQGLNINAATVTVSRLDLESSAGYMHVKGHLKRLFSDPQFDGTLVSEIDLSKLPDAITDKLPASISGIFKADTHVSAHASDFTATRYPRIDASGHLSLDEFTWLADDTLKMYHIDRLDLDLSHRIPPEGGEATLFADLSIDRAQMLAADFAFTYNDISLSARCMPLDTAVQAVPLAGKLHAGYFNMAKLGSGSGCTVHELDGAVAMPAPTAHMSPLFTLDLNAAAMSAGGHASRLALGDCRLVAIAGERSPEPATPERFEKKHVKLTVDSLRRQAPHIPLDSVYMLALRIHFRDHRPGHHRVHPAVDSVGHEYIDWGATRVAYQLLSDWAISGTLTAGKARISSPDMRIPNNADNFNITFNTDTASFSNICYRLGGSDFLLSGRITDMRRGFTSADGAVPLRTHVAISSHKIDMDQLGDIIFPVEDDKTDTTHVVHRPLLLPVNLNTELDFCADSIIYSGLVLKDFAGTAMMYQGAVNLHQLTARSEVGSVQLSGMYSAPSLGSISAGIGLKVNKFNIADFLRLVPEVDSVMPILHNFAGTVSADIAATTDIGPDMNLVVPSMRVAMSLEGDSLQLLNRDLWHKVTRWLFLSSNEGDVIPHAFAQLTMRDSHLELYPFIFDFNRYRLGVQGHYDIDSTFNYHVAVLRSPIPFRFGINISGSPHHTKVRFGGPKLNENNVSESRLITADKRINLVNEIEGMFRRGMRRARFAPLVF